MAAVLNRQGLAVLQNGRTKITVQLYLIVAGPRSGTMG